MRIFFPFEIVATRRVDSCSTTLFALLKMCTEKLYCDISEKLCTPDHAAVCVIQTTQRWPEKHAT